MATRGETEGYDSSGFVALEGVPDAFFRSKVQLMNFTTFCFQFCLTSIGLSVIEGCSK